jgi:hypothetical protein
MNVLTGIFQPNGTQICVVKVLNNNRFANFMKMAVVIESTHVIF